MHYSFKIWRPAMYTFIFLTTLQFLDIDENQLKINIQLILFADTSLDVSPVFIECDLYVNIS